MKVKITKTSKMSFEEFREIKTLEELLDLRKEFKAGIVIDNTDQDDCDIEVEIYDDYRE